MWEKTEYRQAMSWLPFSAGRRTAPAGSDPFGL